MYVASRTAEPGNEPGSLRKTLDIGDPVVVCSCGPGTASPASTLSRGDGTWNPTSAFTRAATWKIGVSADDGYTNVPLTTWPCVAAVLAATAVPLLVLSPTTVLHPALTHAASTTAPSHTHTDLFIV